MQELGKQCNIDNIEDKSGFKAKARLHQSKYRAEKLKAPYDTHGNFLEKEDGEKGLNFYKGFGVFDAVKKYRRYNKQLYSNLLRSEHIPFNFFIPLRSNKDFCKAVFNKLLGNCIKSIERIEIEYAPSKPEKFLNDKTSFDAYIEFTHVDNKKGIIGIEVKYTEQDYKLKAGSKQHTDINNRDSLYYKVSENSKLYKSDTIDKLVSDRFRQVWRNHLLAASITHNQENDFEHFFSMTFYPSENLHFVEVSKEYQREILKDDDSTFVPITYKKFYSVLREFCPNKEYLNWLQYLESRYIA